MWANDFIFSKISFLIWRLHKTCESQGSQGILLPWALPEDSPIEYTLDWGEIYVKSGVSVESMFTFSTKNKSML